MATENNNSNGGLYFLVGALLAVVIGFGVWYFTQGAGTPANDADLSITVDDGGIEVDGN